MSPDDPSDAPRGSGPSARLARVLGTPPVRGRRVRRTIRHVEPWSVLKIALLFHAALFLIICVASALLWTAARASGTLDNVESFITSVGGFGNCEPIDGASRSTTTTTTTAPADAEVDQLDPDRQTTVAEDEDALLEEEPDDEIVPDEDEDCGEGSELVGEFRFEDGRIFQAFAFGGVVLVLAGTGATVVLVLLFNLMSDLTGGVQMTVIEDDPRPRREAGAGSPPRERRG
jgi:hypothetical protein